MSCSRAAPPLPHPDASIGYWRLAKHRGTLDGAKTEPLPLAVMVLGGFGVLSRLHGLSIDNLVEAEVVAADESMNKKEHPVRSIVPSSAVLSNKESLDPWWALCSSGPALCVATRFKARAYPVPVVFAGNLI